ncbi:unnamed protein product [Brassica oleracea var. botrytis]
MNGYKSRKVRSGDVSVVKDVSHIPEIKASDVLNAYKKMCIDWLSLTPLIYRIRVVLIGSTPMGCLDNNFFFPSTTTKFELHILQEKAGHAKDDRSYYGAWIQLMSDIEEVICPKFMKHLTVHWDGMKASLFMQSYLRGVLSQLNSFHLKRLM